MHGRHLPVVERSRFHCDTSKAGREIGASAGAHFGNIRGCGNVEHILAIESTPEPLVRFTAKDAGLRNVHVVEPPYHATAVSADSCERVPRANLWTELPDPELGHCSGRTSSRGGRLITDRVARRRQCREAPKPLSGFREMIQLLEKNTVGHCTAGRVGPCIYFLEAPIFLPQMHFQTPASPTRFWSPTVPPRYTGRPIPH